MAAERALRVLAEAMVATDGVVDALVDVCKVRGGWEVVGIGGWDRSERAITLIFWQGSEPKRPSKDAASVPQNKHGRSASFPPFATVTTKN